MQHIHPLIGLISAALWLAYLYRQHLDLAWLFLYVSKLRRARKARRWTIEEVAEKVGVDWTTYSRWERGQQEPHQRNVKELEQAFSMKAEDLGMDQISRRWRQLVRSGVEGWSDYAAVFAISTLAAMAMDRTPPLKWLIENAPVEYRETIRQLVKKRNAIVSGLAQQ
jgi:transcriptional regulator with XRE-family HTH domain